MAISFSIFTSHLKLKVDLCICFKILHVDMVMNVWCVTFGTVREAKVIGLITNNVLPTSLSKG